MIETGRCSAAKGCARHLVGEATGEVNASALARCQQRDPAGPCCYYTARRLELRMSKGKTRGESILEFRLGVWLMSYSRNSHLMSRSLFHLCALHLSTILVSYLPLLSSPWPSASRYDRTEYRPTAGPDVRSLSILATVACCKSRLSSSTALCTATCVSPSTRR